MTSTQCLSLEYFWIFSALLSPFEYPVNILSSEWCSFCSFYYSSKLRQLISLFLCFPLFLSIYILSGHLYLCHSLSFSFVISSFSCILNRTFHCSFPLVSLLWYVSSSYFKSFYILGSSGRFSLLPTYLLSVSCSFSRPFISLISLYNFLG